MTADFPRVVSASLRTDIPRVLDWFINRIRAGFCVYTNPLYPQIPYRVSLAPRDVQGIVFWTRHAAPIAVQLPELDQAGFAYYFQYTVVGYPRSLDQRGPSLQVAIRTFLDLSKRVAPERIL